ncbi:HEAT domain protein repeat-containing protein [Calothrix sp. NIES-4071]|nr:HEAT domain protein repeat-containing protein [Calothrix sp. NIES-4071]BAZ62165.1 HEAT domain protein repeat-containing protein [Calothrix sp. NIES-4105]
MTIAASFSRFIVMKNLVKQSLMVIKRWQLKSRGCSNPVRTTLPQMEQDKQTVSELIARLNDDLQRPDAVIALGNFGREAETVVPALIEVLKNEDVTLRINAIESLCKIRDDKAIEPLINALQDASAQVRATAAFALGCFRFQAITAVEPLIMSLEDSDEWVRTKAVEALSYIRHPKATVHLATALHDNYPGVRAKAALALPNIAEASFAVPLLIAALTDTDARVRAAVADGLGMFGSDALDSAPHLLNALHSEDLYVQINAAKALIKIGSHIGHSMNILMQMLEKEDASTRITTALNLGIIALHFQDKAYYLSVLELEQVIYHLETVSYLLKTNSDFDAAQFALVSINNALSSLKKERKSRGN